MKIINLLESFRSDFLEFQQRLIDGLDDRFEVKAENVINPKIATYKLYLRHPNLSRAIIILINEKSPQVMIGATYRFDFNDEKTFEHLIDRLEDKVGVKDIISWVNDHGFTECQALDFQQVRWVCGLKKTDVLFKRGLKNGETLLIKVSKGSNSDGWLLRDHEYAIVTPSVKRLSSHLLFSNMLDAHIKPYIDKYDKPKT